MKLFAWCDSPLAPTGFGRSARHVLTALHGAGWEIIQLSVNQDPSRVQEIPWKVFMPLDRGADPYGLQVLPEIIENHRPDMMWTTFDPEVPWKYAVPGAQCAGQQVNAMDYIMGLRDRNPGFRSVGWFPIDGGPLSDFEMAVMGAGPQFDYVASMSDHVHDLIEWTLRLRGHAPNMEQVRGRVHTIPHGISAKEYPVPGKGEKVEARRKLGLPEDAFIVTQVERNQQRKQNYLGLEVMEALFKIRPELRGKTVLYQHMLRDEENAGCQLGFNLPELCWRYGLKPNDDVRWPADFLPEDQMVLVYQAADIFLSTSTGEGFQYPAWEALSCGTPILVPNNSARAAWFKGAPGATLYRNDDRRLVMRGGYNRRMAMADPVAAAQKLIKLMKQQPTPANREAMHAWVQKQASVESVQALWVDVMEKEKQTLIAQRKAMKVTTPGDLTADTLTVRMGASPGLGDLCLAAPALRALQQQGRRVNLQVPTTHLGLAQLMQLADTYEVRPTPGATEIICIDDLYRDGHRDGWGDPKTHRSDVIAKHLRVDPASMVTAVTQIGSELTQQVRNQFISTFGVDPTSCVGVALESANQHRSLPQTYLPQLEAGITALGLTPVILGRQALNIQRIGTADLTGKTDLPYLIGLIEQLGALITVDSAQLHFAGMVGTPMVACFTLFEPDTRLRYYTSEVEALSAVGPIEGEEFPAGPNTRVTTGAWAATIKPEDILSALRRLLGVEDAGPKVIRPGGIHERIE